MAVANLYELLQDMGLGWNLGNTFDAAKNDGTEIDRTDVYDLARRTARLWGNPDPTFMVFDAVKHAGYRSIRFPITWGEHINELDVIDIEYFDYINTFVDYIVNTLDMYCIINMHHDDRIWWNADTIASDPAIMEKYVNFWNQIATYFASYGEKLIFAGFNEPLDTAENWDNSSIESRTNLNDVGDAFVSAVRAISGNENRYLCIPAYASKVYALQNVHLPDDKCFSDVHIYMTSASALKGAIDVCLKYNRPFIVGEFGIQNSQWTDPDVVSAMSFFITLCKAHNIPTYLWDDGGNMKFLDRHKAADDYTNLNAFTGTTTTNAINMMVAACIVKDAPLILANRKTSISVGTTTQFSPTMKPDLNFYTFLDGEIVTLSDNKSNELVAVREGTIDLLSIGEYGYYLSTSLVVNNENEYSDNVKMNLQNIENWTNYVSREFDALPVAEYIFNTHKDFICTFEELSVLDDIISTVTITGETGKYKLTTDILTNRIRITISELLTGTYSAMRTKFGKNTINMDVLFSCYAHESPTLIDETGVFVRKLLTKNTKLMVSESVTSDVISCVNIDVPAVFNIEVGDTIDINDSLSLVPVDANQTVSFKNLDIDKMSLSLDGKVTSTRPAEGTIVITCGEQTKNIAINVNGIYVENTNINLTDTTTVPIDAIPTPSNSILSWTSSNTDVATIDNSGNITAIADGTTEVIVTSGSYSETIHIVVTDVTIKTPVDFIASGGGIDLGTTFNLHSDTIEITAKILPEYTESFAMVSAGDGAEKFGMSFNQGANPGELLYSYKYESDWITNGNYGNKQTFKQAGEKVYIDDELMVTLGQSFLETTSNIIVNLAHLKLYGIKVWEYDTLLMELEPALDEDMVACLYNRTNGTFIYPQVPTIAGNDLNDEILLNPNENEWDGDGIAYATLDNTRSLGTAHSIEFEALIDSGSSYILGTLETSNSFIKIEEGNGLSYVADGEGVYIAKVLRDGMYHKYKIVRDGLNVELFRDEVSVYSGELTVNNTFTVNALFKAASTAWSIFDHKIKNIKINNESIVFVKPDNILSTSLSNWTIVNGDGNRITAV